jgi:predicted O-linked N-acetylglucosamine transferase (SPINDLY family)
VCEYILAQFLIYGIKKENIQIKSDSLAIIKNQVHVVIDSFPAGSPTATRDLIHMGVPVLSLQGTTPYSRFSASFLHGLNLDFLIFNSEDELFKACKDLITIRDKFLKIKVKDRFAESNLALKNNLIEFVGNLI